MNAANALELPNLKKRIVSAFGLGLAALMVLAIGTGTGNLKYQQAVSLDLMAATHPAAVQTATEHTAELSAHRIIKKLDAENQVTQEYAIDQEHITSLDKSNAGLEGEPVQSDSTTNQEEEGSGAGDPEPSPEAGADQLNESDQETGPPGTGSTETGYEAVPVQLNEPSQETYSDSGDEAAPAPSGEQAAAQTVPDQPEPVPVSADQTEPILAYAPVIEEASELWTEAEVTAAAQTVYGEAGNIASDREVAAVMWCILNRVDSPEFPNTIMEVILSPNQFYGYIPTYPVTERVKGLVLDVLARWKAEKQGGDNVGRVLPADYCYFWGNDYHNYFRNRYRGGTVWDWSLPTPYDSYIVGEKQLKGQGK